MNTISDFHDYRGLLNILNRCYKLDFKEIALHREMIGYVYFVTSQKQKYALKLYRHFHTEQALQSIDIIQYLAKKDYPVVSIVPAGTGKSYFTLSVPEGDCIGILYKFIVGVEPNLKTEIQNVGRQAAELHNLMAEFPRPLIRRGKGFYIDRVITMMQQLNYPDNKVADLDRYGRELWRSMERCPRGFSHGDLHTGNMLQTKTHEYILFDFDIASHAYSIIDVSTLCNATDFNHLSESEYDSTMRMFERFYQGYSQKRLLSDIEIAAMFDFTAIRHYELIATITECQGLHSLSKSFLDQQYDWLMQWRSICRRKRA